MDIKYEWNLKDIYEDEGLIDRDVQKLESSLNEIEAFKGTLGESSENIASALRKLLEIIELEERLYGYAMLKYHKDMSNGESIKLYKKIESLATNVSAKTSFIDPELSKVDTDILLKFLEENEFLKIEFNKFIKDIIKEKEHILSEELESTLARFAEIFGAFENTYELFTNTEFDFPEIYVDGEKKQITHGTYSLFMKHPNREVRKQAFESMYSLYKRHQNSITELYISRVKKSTITANLRKYNSSLDMACKGDDSTVDVYNTLLSEVNKNLDLNHRFINLKKKMLGLDEMHLYDMYVNTLEEESKKVEFEEGRQIVLDALSPLGEKYIQKLRFIFDNRWLDVYETPNKRSGGYSMSVYGVHPYILLNYMDTMRDVSTVAHELGHTMHSVFANENQNVLNANYTIMVAEVASTVNEILLANYLINKEENELKKAALINEQLDTIRATLYRQSMFAEFEKIVHEKVEAGESLSSENLDEIYYELNEKYHGKGVVCDEEIKYEWARIPHFYSCFYVYKYATGITSAIVIAKNILEQGEEYVNRYIEMLSKGGSIGSLDLLKMVDVDLEKPETYEKAFDYFRSNLEELEKIVNNK